MPPKIDKDTQFAERLVNVVQRLNNTTLSVSHPDIKQIVNLHNTLTKVVYECVTEQQIEVLNFRFWIIMKNMQENSNVTFLLGKLV